MPGHRKDYLLRKHFGISLEQYNIMVEDQGGRCAICGEESQLHVDHDHETTEVRGLLCNNCNNGLGRFLDRPDLLRKAAEYLAPNP
jgi:hypothetical protein